MAEDVIVVTGAAGLIGSGVVRHLNDLGKKVVAVDVLDHVDKRRNVEGKEIVEWVSIGDLKRWLEGREVGAIIHLGACSDTLEKRWDYLLQNNTQYTMDLATYALKRGVRFIYASSAATYGDGSRGFSDAHEGLELLEPLNLYGRSKHWFDLWAKKEGVLDQIVGLKYFNVFGPTEAHKGHMASMVYKMVPVVQKEKKIRLFKSTEPEKFADGGQCRDFIYVKDAVKMTCSFLEDERGGIFNIGMGRPTTWNALAAAVFKALGQPVEIEYVDMPPELARQYQNYTCAEMTKYGRHLLEYDIEKAVDDYINGYLMKDRRW